MGIMRQKAKAKSWFTYKCGTLTVLKWCPLFKIRAIFLLNAAFMCLLALMLGLNPNSRDRLNDPIISFEPPRSLEINFMHPYVLAALAVVLFALLVDLLIKIRMQMAGRAIIFGQKKVWVRGLNGMHPVRWEAVDIVTQTGRSARSGLRIDLVYRGRKISLKQEDFFLFDLRYLRDAIEWTRPDVG
jgi:hypothetical protein